MKKITTYSTLLLATLFTISIAQADEPHKHWGYTGDVAPKHWSELEKDYHTCVDGKSQSPINIQVTDHLGLTAMDLNYTTGSQTLVNNGHSVQVNIKEGSTFTMGSDVYELKQFHFHTPSENNINAKSYPLEIHFVHATKDNKLAVIAVMFEEGEANPVLAKIWKKLPTLKLDVEQKCGLTADEVKSLMPENKEYYEFTGSLTTPPCTEHVDWHVFKTPMTISKEQVQQFFNLYGHSNNRPIQDTNGREIDD